MLRDLKNMTPIQTPKKILTVNRVLVKLAFVQPPCLLQGLNSTHFLVKLKEAHQYLFSKCLICLGTVIT